MSEIEDDKLAPDLDGANAPPQIAAIAIGRNEGERLKRCLYSLAGVVETIVYVDSGSTDGSVAFARQLSVEVVELDMTRPFTAARARNAGFGHLQATSPNVPFVFFIDGDCELIPGWLEAAEKTFEGHSQTAVVCGNVRERYPDASIYNRLAQMEWHGSVGKVDSCGGIFVIRCDTFDAVGMFNATMIAGEEPELCLRLRRAGWTVQRIGADMTWHDAAMTRFGQWWKRSVRSGHAYAEGAVMYGRSPERHSIRSSRSNWFWGLLLPIVLLGLAWPTYGWSVAGLLVYPLMMFRVSYRRRLAYRDPWRHALLYGLFVMLSKFPGVIGQVTYYVSRVSGNDSTLIEYKAATNY